MLDLGCGDGLDVLLAAERVGPGGRVVGLDVNPDMLHLARHNAARPGVTNAEFLQGDIEVIPLPDASVDAILSNCVINLTPDKRQALQEAFRVLRPGDRLAVSDRVFLGDVSALPVSLRQNLAAWAGCLAGALTVDEYRTLLEVAGFSEIQIDITRSWEPESSEAEELAHHLPPTDVAAARQAARAGGIRLSAADIRARRPLAPNPAPGSFPADANGDGLRQTETGGSHDDAWTSRPATGGVNRSRLKRGHQSRLRPRPRWHRRAARGKRGGVFHGRIPGR